MKAISRLEQAGSLDKIVTAGQRPARIIRPGRPGPGVIAMVPPREKTATRPANAGRVTAFPFRSGPG
jgi:hypothetical protein